RLTLTRKHRHEPRLGRPHRRHVHHHRRHTLGRHPTPTHHIHLDHTRPHPTRTQLQPLHRRLVRPRIQQPPRRQPHHTRGRGRRVGSPDRCHGRCHGGRHVW